MTTIAARRGLILTVFLTLVGAILVTLPPQKAQAACAGNAIVCENQLAGTPSSEWDINGSGDGTIQGFATAISVNAGAPITFKIDTDASAYAIKIYRLGWYGGAGARRVDVINPSVPLPQVQPACATDPTTELYDCGTWAVSASWNVPATAVSGVYIAHLIRGDTGGSSHITFIVRNDNNTSDILFQTSDTTWQAYNTYGGSNFYWGGANGRAYKLSYNRPFTTRGGSNGRDFLFANEYPMIRFLEQNGFDVSYVSGLDTSVDANLITKHKMFMSVGHDEYWSKEQRDNVLAARDAGVHMGFFGGNNMYWKTRWESSQDGTSTPNRTLVCYKDTWANTRIDPVEPTPTWRDPRFGNLGHGPENALMGSQYQANTVDLAIKVNSEEGKLRLWRETSLASLPSGNTATLAPHTVGYESDEDVDNGLRPAGLIRLSTTTGPTPEYLTDFGNTVVARDTTHHLTMYRAASGALVFSTASIQWAWGLDAYHDGVDPQPADPRMRQATLNILTDMGARATTLAAGLTAVTKSTDTTAPTATITSPESGATTASGELVTVKGTAADVGGRVGGVEVSVDGGATFHPATGRESFTYKGVLTGTGPEAIQARAIDDSGNIQAVTTKLGVTVDCPCTIFGAITPVTPSVSDTTPVTLGTRFTAANDGFISGIRFYKGEGNTGTHVGTLYSATGESLASATFADESGSGWQTVRFVNAVPIKAGTTYVAAYYAPNGHYPADVRFFAYRNHSSGTLTALGGWDNPNGVFAFNNRFPTESSNQTNYYVDAIYTATDTTPLSVTTVSPVPDSTSVPTTTTVTATFSRTIEPSVQFTVVDPDNNQVPGSVTYSEDAKTAIFTPAQSLGTTTAYSVMVTASPDSGVGLPAPHQWSFTTARPPAEPGVCPCTLFDDADGPTIPPVSETDRVQLGMAFTSNTAGLITGIRFYKSSTNTGTHAVTLWSGSGSELATATVPEESAAGWQEAKFASPVKVKAKTTYIASYVAPKGRYSAQAGGLKESIVRPPLSSLEGAGRFTYGTNAPLSKSATNYFVDPVFNVDPTLPPEVAATSPGAGATSVPVTARFTVDFSGPIQADSASITVKRKDTGASVAGSTATGSSSSSVTFTPDDDLLAATAYTATISGAKSLSGVSMTEPMVSEFTTSGAAACPCSLLETTSVPVVSDSEDTSATTLGVRFKAAVDGSIKGLRYFRDDKNTGTHIGKLWSSTGTELASVTFSDSGSGWQTATFSTPVNVDAGKTYVASYYAPKGHYSVAINYFAEAVVNSPLSSVDSGGVYADGDSFPDRSYLRSHYYVDVVFTTENNAPPEVTDVSPGSGGTNVDVTTRVKATFNRAMEPSTLVMTLIGPNDAVVSGQVSYDAETRTATFQPAADVDPATTYTTSVSGTSTTGIAMSSPHTWSFTTRAAAPDGEQVSLFSMSDSPAVAAWDDSDPVTVGVRFNSSVSGQAIAIRFYAGPGNTGDHTVNLWNSEGESLATGAASGSETGWRTVTFDTPVPITAGQTYTASYRAPAGHYSLTGSAFSAPYSNGPLTVPEAGGTYRYSTGAPTASSTANFWVDVVIVIPD